MAKATDEFGVYLDEPRRQVRIPLSGLVICQLLDICRKDRHLVIDTDLPDGAKFVRWYYSYDSDCMNVVVEHESFEEVPEGQEIPLHMAVRFTLVDTVAKIREMCQSVDEGDYTASKLAAEILELLDAR